MSNDTDNFALNPNPQVLALDTNIDSLLRLAADREAQRDEDDIDDQEGDGVLVYALSDGEDDDESRSDPSEDLEYGLEQDGK